MTLNPVRYALILTAFAMMLDGCEGSEAQPLLDAGDFGDGGARGCVQPNFPDEQPDLSAADRPKFLLTTSAAQQSTSGQAVVDPGDPIEAELTVNGATRLVKIELGNAWSPDEIIDVEEIETAGGQLISLLLFGDERAIGRFYMKLTLCGFDCDERRVVFDINPDVNSPYERTVIENGEVLQVDRTCIDFKARQGIGSGTVLIQ